MGPSRVRNGQPRASTAAAGDPVPSAPSELTVVGIIRLPRHSGRRLEDEQRNRWDEVQARRAATARAT